MNLDSFTGSLIGSFSGLNVDDIHLAIELEMRLHSYVVAWCALYVHDTPRHNMPCTQHVTHTMIAKNMMITPPTNSTRTYSSPLFFERF